jgi:hypothetical protein
MIRISIKREDTEYFSVHRLTITIYNNTNYRKQRTDYSIAWKWLPRDNAAVACSCWQINLVVVTPTEPNRHAQAGQLHVFIQNTQSQKLWAKDYSQHLHFRVGYLKSGGIKNHNIRMSRKLGAFSRVNPARKKQSRKTLINWIYRMYVSRRQEHERMNTFITCELTHLEMAKHKCFKTFLRCKYRGGNIELPVQKRRLWQTNFNLIKCQALTSVNCYRISK